MTDVPQVDVIIVTWNRPKEVAETFNSLRENLRYPNLHFIIADGHSEPSVQDFMRRELEGAEIVVPPRRGGWGADVNLALRRSQALYVFMIEDDYPLLRPIDLMPAVRVLGGRKEIGMVRYRALAGHDLTCRLREAHIDGDTYQVWQILRSSAFLFCYTHGPHLKHRRFHEHYGLYAEGLMLGDTEVEMCWRWKKNPGPAIVAFPEFVMPTWFGSIGHSRQLSDTDIGITLPEWNKEIPRY